MLSVEANVEVDFTALEALDQVRDELSRDGVVLVLARVKQDLPGRLEAFGLAGKIGPGLLSPPCRPRSMPAGAGPRRIRCPHAGTPAEATGGRPPGPAHEPAPAKRDTPGRPRAVWDLRPGAATTKVSAGAPRRRSMIEVLLPDSHGEEVPAVNRWVLLASATAGAAVLVAALAGKDDIRRFLQMRKM